MPCRGNASTCANAVCGAVVRLCAAMFTQRLLYRVPSFARLRIALNGLFRRDEVWQAGRLRFLSLLSLMRLSMLSLFQIAARKTRHGT